MSRDCVLASERRRSATASPGPHPVLCLKQDEADAAAVRRCLEGESTAFAELVERYQRPLFNVALRLLGRYEEAADATQNAFLKSYAHLNTFDPTQRFFSWICRVMRNECLNTIRAKRASEPLSDDMVGTVRPVDAVEAAERDRAVQQALMSLSTEYREVIALRHFGEMSSEEIAVTLGVPAKTRQVSPVLARQCLAERLSAWKAGVSARFETASSIRPAAVGRGAARRRAGDRAAIGSLAADHDADC